MVRTLADEPWVLRDMLASADLRTPFVAADPGLTDHPGLADLVGETVGDEERAAYLDKV